MIPSDPMMLVSYVNLKLRDCYDSPEAMCDDLDVDQAEMEQKLKDAGFTYDKASNQYR